MSKKRRRKSKLPKLIFLILFVAAAIITVFAIKAFTEDISNKPSEPTSTTDKNSSSQEKETSPKDSDQSEGSNPSEESENPESDSPTPDYIKEKDPTDPNLSTYVTGAVSKALFTKDKYRIAITTDQALSEGACDLEFWSDSVHPTPITASADIVAHPNASSCTFDLDSITPGFWNLKVTVYTTKGRSGIIEDKIEVVK